MNDSNSQWKYVDITASSGAAPSTPESALTSFTLSDGPHVVYLGQNGHVLQIMHDDAANQWRFGDLTASAPGSTFASPTGSLATLNLPDGPHIVYVDANERLCQLWYNTATKTWTYQNLTTAIGTPFVQNPPSLDPLNPAREYIHLNGELIAIENHP